MLPPSPLSASASSSGGEPTAGSTTSRSTGTQPPDLSGTWSFVLASSDVAAPLREECAKNPATREVCWKEIETQSVKEKIRFTASDETGHAVWTSFGTDGAEETLSLEVPVELTADGPSGVLAKVAGKAKGKKAPGSRSRT